MQRITKIESTQNRTKEKLRVAAYARVSTSSTEQIASLNAQREYYERYIKSNPRWEYAGIYYDEGITGTNLEKRDGLLRLIADCENGLIDYIIVKSISRFSRNTVDSLETVRHLFEIGVFICFEKEKIDTGKMEGEFLLSVLSSLAESESHSISENMKWGIQKRFQSGTYKISFPPYGYENKNGEMIIVPEQAEVVRWIFKEVIAGKAAHAIAGELNERGVPTMKNTAWSSKVISMMIKNEKYTGDVLLQRTYTDYLFKRHVNRGERDRYYIENHHEPIISHEEYEAANRMLQMNADEKGIVRNCSKYANRYIFSGNIICGECGCKFKRRAMKSYAAYVCGGHIKERNSCGNIGMVREESIKAAFTTMMNKLIFGRSSVLIPYRSMMNDTNSADEKFVKVNVLDMLIEENAEKKKRLVNFFSKGFIDPDVYVVESDNLCAEGLRLNAERIRLAGLMNIAGGTKDSLEDLLKFTAKDRMLSEFDEDLYKRFVDYIVVFNKSEIGFAMKCGPVFRERIS